MDWTTHTASAAIGAILGAVLPFLLNLRKHSSDDLRSIIQTQGERIASLEARVEALHTEHSDCLRAQLELRAKIAALEAENAKAVVLPFPK